MNNLLFVCSGNKLRSPSAEVFFKNNNFNTRSAGTSKNAINIINLNDILWADKIFFMENKHFQRTYSAFPRVMQFKKTEILNIPDDFKYLDAKLISIFRKINIII